MKTQFNFISILKKHTNRALINQFTEKLAEISLEFAGQITLINQLCKSRKHPFIINFTTEDIIEHHQRFASPKKYISIPAHTKSKIFHIWQKAQEIHD